MFQFITAFLKLEASGGLVLMAAAALSMLFANGIPVAYTVPEAARHVINDGLMTFFFLLVGLEIKREVVEGELSSKAKAFLPCAAALGGIMVPAIIFSLFNVGSENMRGWAIPTATDIAFSLGVLALFGSRVPIALKVFLMALAVMDDLAAVVIIAIFYTAQLSVGPLLAALACVAVLGGMNRLGVVRIVPYLLVGAALWFFVLQSGVHATVAGVALGALMPIAAGKKLIGIMHPWVAFFVVPLFAFANAGISVSEFSLAAIFDPVAAGIAFGLIVGKPVGIISVMLLLNKLKISVLPTGSTWMEFVAVSCLAGIGFTMSLFIGGLAFNDFSNGISVKIGIIVGSLISVMMGCLLMALSLRGRASMKGIGGV